MLALTGFRLKFYSFKILPSWGTQWVYLSIRFPCGNSRYLLNYRQVIWLKIKNDSSRECWEFQPINTVCNFAKLIFGYGLFSKTIHDNYLLLLVALFEAHAQYYSRHTWLFAQKYFWQGLKGTMWNAGDRTHIGCLQGKHPPHCTISPNPLLLLFL